MSTAADGCGMTDDVGAVKPNLDWFFPFAACWCSGSSKLRVASFGVSWISRTLQARSTSFLIRSWIQSLGTTWKDPKSTWANNNKGKTQGVTCCQNTSHQAPKRHVATPITERLIRFDPSILLKATHTSIAANHPSKQARLINRLAGRHHEANQPRHRGPHNCILHGGHESLHHPTKSRQDDDDEKEEEH
jgi:hypothetical protein